MPKAGHFGAWEQPQTCRGGAGDLQVTALIVSICLRKERPMPVACGAHHRLADLEQPKDCCFGRGTASHRKRHLSGTVVGGPRGQFRAVRQSLPVNGIAPDTRRGGWGR